VPRLHEHLALRETHHRECLRVAEALGDREPLPRHRRRALELTRRLELEDLRQQQVAALGAVGRLLLEEALRPAEPAAPWPELAAENEAHPNPERIAHGGGHVPLVQPGVVGALEHGHVLVVAAEQVRGAREQLEVARRERGRAIRRRETFVRLPPGPLAIGLAPSLAVAG
jgi:hypothetical protein